MERILPDDNELLKSLYKQYRIPTDQYKRRPLDLQRFVSQWNMLTDRVDEPGELLHYMISQRKQNKWVCLGRNHEKCESVPADVLSEEEWEHLRQVYIDLGKGSDNYSYYSNLQAELETHFARRAGRLVAGYILAAAIEVRRKRGLWVTLGDDGEPFGDMDAIAI